MPGAIQAARSTSSRSVQERTLPLRMTASPSASTLMPLASIRAAALEGRLDARLDIGRDGLVADLDGALDAAYAMYMAQRQLRVLALVVPVHRAFQPDMAVLDDDLDRS